MCRMILPRVDRLVRSLYPFPLNPRMLLNSYYTPALEDLFSSDYQQGTSDKDGYYLIYFPCSSLNL
jgi:hypothetical protein